ncbi:MAG TPA: DUF2520 domain-containing protein [Actinomycetota bacterium]
MKVAVVGAGRVGTAMGVLLSRAGHTVVAVSGRGVGSRERAERHLPGTAFVGSVEAARRGEVVLLTVPDDRILDVCGTLVKRGALESKPSLVHCSGANPLQDLAPAAEIGASILSVHPLQTAPSVEAAIERFPGSGFAVTARDEDSFLLGERLAADAGGRPFRLLDEHKGLYHAAAVFASNYLVVVEGLADDLFELAGIPDPRPLFGPLAEGTLANVMEQGAARALTGPVARGDAGTVRRNLEALRVRAPSCVAPYAELARAAVRIASEAGRLNDRDRAEIEEVLREWT